MIGEQLGGYAIQSELGSGGMGKVYLAAADGMASRAEAPQEQTRVALKVLHPHLIESQESLERFMREAEIGGRIHHDNVVRTLDAGSAVVGDATHHYLVMEYVEGQTLRGLLAELGKVPEELCRHIGCEIAGGLGAIHAAGVVHRDLKPENVLITEEHVVKVMDLGVALLQDAAFKLSQTGTFLGSVLYAAPEQFRGEAPDSRADFYSLGLMLYELATGRHPFQADAFADVLRRQLEEEPRPVAELNPQLSPFYEEVCKALLQKDRGRRMGFLPAGEESDWWTRRARAIRLETKRPLRRIRIPRETALYGRDDDLARLGALYERAKAGHGGVLLIEGEAGIGKTRLVDEFVGRLQRDGEDLNFLFGSYPPGGAATASGAFTTAYGEHFGHEGLDEALAGYLASTPVLVPAFASLLRGEPTPKGEDTLTKDSLQTVFVHATRGLAAERPTIVLLDDLHFAPEEGRALFTALALAAPGHRILLVGTMRPGAHEEWIASMTRLEQWEQISLARLGPKDLIRLLQDSFQSERLAEGLGVKIALKSDGNPFFAIEIIAGLREGQFITQGPDGTWVTTQIIEEIQVPSSVMDLISARIADLDEDERDLLDVAACCGYEFDPSLVGAALGVGRIPVLKRCGQVERKHRLIRSAGRQYVFDHHQVQEALYAGLHDQLRESYHAAIGETLETQTNAASGDPDEVDGALAGDLAEHFLKGACGQRALRYLDCALGHLERNFVVETAIRLSDRALAEKGLLAGEARAKVLIRKASRHNQRGEREPQRAALDEALVLADASGDPLLRAEVRAGLGHLVDELARHEESLEILREALPLAEEAGDPRVEGRVHMFFGHALKALGRLGEARQHYEKQLEFALKQGDPRAHAEAHGSLGLVLHSEGRFEDALRSHKKDLEIVRSVRARPAEAKALGNIGQVLESLGRATEARRHHEQCLEIAREGGHRRTELIACNQIGGLDYDMGRFDEARAMYERALELAHEIRYGAAEAAVTGNLGLVHYSLGRLADATTSIEHHLALSRESGHLTAQATAHINSVSVRLMLGDLDAAREHAKNAVDTAREANSPRLECHGLEALGDIARRTGDHAEAERVYRDVLDRQREMGHVPGMAVSLELLGGLLAELGRGDEARPLLEEAVRLSDDAGLPSTQVLAAAHLAAVSGDPASALDAWHDVGDRADVPAQIGTGLLLWKLTGETNHLEHAHRLLADVRDHAPEEFRDTMIENVPLHREIMEAWTKHGGTQ